MVKASMTTVYAVPRKKWTYYLKFWMSYIFMSVDMFVYRLIKHYFIFKYIKFLFFPFCCIISTEKLKMSHPFFMYVHCHLWLLKSKLNMFLTKDIFLCMFWESRNVFHYFGNIVNTHGSGNLSSGLFKIRKKIHNWNQLNMCNNEVAIDLEKR